MPDNSDTHGSAKDLASQVVIWDVVQRNSLIVRGDDAGSYLHSQLSNDINALAPGDSCQSFVLEPTGKINALVRVTRLANGLQANRENAKESDPSPDAKFSAAYLVDSDANDEDFSQLLRRLERFKIRVKADFISQPVYMVSLLLTGRSGLVNSVDTETLDTGTLVTDTAGNGSRLSRDQLRLDLAKLNELARDLVVVDAWWGDGRTLDALMLFPSEPASQEIPNDLLMSLITVLSDSGWVVRRAEPTEIEQWRIRTGWPAMGSEIQPGVTIPAATGIIRRAASFTKGCYPGQELVERMDSRGSTAPQSLRVVPLVELGSVQPGDVIKIQESDVGIVTSVASDVALAYVSRTVELGITVGNP